MNFVFIFLYWNFVIKIIVRRITPSNLSCMEPTQAMYFLLLSSIYRMTGVLPTPVIYFLRLTLKSQRANENYRPSKYFGVMISIHSFIQHF